jgi:hypothetical protein
MHPNTIEETARRKTDYFDFKARSDAMQTLRKYEVITEPEYQMLRRRVEDLDRAADGEPPIPREFNS